MKNNGLYYIVGIFILLFIFFIFGYKYRSITYKCTIASDSILVHDTITHVITNAINHYIIKKDTVIITKTEFMDVDTFSILLDYYSIKKYTREWEDSLIKITLKDEIQENAPYNSEISYKLLKPQQIIVNNVDNSVAYNSYLTLGVVLPFKEMKYTNIGLNYVNRNWYIGAGYMPDAKSISISGGVTVFKFKNK